MNKKIIIALCLIAAFGAIVFFWQKYERSSTNAGSGTQNGTGTTGSQTQISGNSVEVGGAQTPTEAYTMLYNAVKAKQPEAIKKMLTEKTLGFAQMAGSQQKKDINQVVENGFTATTFAASLPQMRDERVKDNMGALEVWNEKDKKWEDLPFMLEDGGWKLAIGEIFAGIYQKPAKGQAQIEAEAANTNKMIPYDKGNPNGANPTVNSNVTVQKPMQMPQKPLMPPKKPFQQPK